jgi:hypothetical protein
MENLSDVNNNEPTAGGELVLPLPSINKRER